MALAECLAECKNKTPISQNWERKTRKYNFRLGIGVLLFSKSNSSSWATVLERHCVISIRQRRKKTKGTTKWLSDRLIWCSSMSDHWNRAWDDGLRSYEETLELAAIATSDKPGNNLSPLNRFPFSFFFPLCFFICIFSWLSHFPPLVFCPTLLVMALQ